MTDAVKPDDDQCNGTIKVLLGDEKLGKLEPRHSIVWSVDTSAHDCH